LATNVIFIIALKCCSLTKRDVLSKFTYPKSFKGRYSGVFVLVILQFLNGVVHAVIGLSLISAGSGVLIYNIYTFLYGFFNILFGYALWGGKKSGWLGTVTVSLFVIVVDLSAIFDMPLIAGVPKNAALGEILFSLFVMTYLFQPKIIRLFKEAR